MVAFAKRIAVGLGQGWDVHAGRVDSAGEGQGFI
jgi:hypothetical protein